MRLSEHTIEARPPAPVGHADLGEGVPRWGGHIARMMLQEPLPPVA